MNPVFWLIVIIVLVLLWFFMSFAFKGIGGIAMKLWNDAKNEMNDNKEKEGNSNEG